MIVQFFSLIRVRSGHGVIGANALMNVVFTYQQEDKKDRVHSDKTKFIVNNVFWMVSHMAPNNSDLPRRLSFNTSPLALGIYIIYLSPKDHRRDFLRTIKYTMYFGKNALGTNECSMICYFIILCNHSLSISVIGTPVES